MNALLLVAVSDLIVGTVTFLASGSVTATAAVMSTWNIAIAVGAWSVR